MITKFKIYESLSLDKLFKGAYVLCVYSDTPDFDYGEKYLIQNIGPRKEAMSITDNNGKGRLFQGIIGEEDDFIIRANSARHLECPAKFTTDDTLQDYEARIQSEKFGL